MKCLLILCLVWVLCNWWIFPVIRSERKDARYEAEREALEWERHRAQKYENMFYKRFCE